MNIKPINTEIVPAAAKPKANANSRPAPAEVQPDAVQVARREELLAKVRSSSEARPEVVARAKALAADPAYPSNELMSRLARMFVNNV